MHARLCRRLVLAFGQLQQRVRHLADIGDVLGDLHSRYGLPVCYDGDRAVDRRDLLAVEILIGLLLSQGRIILFERLEHRAVVQAEIRESLMELFP